MENHYKLENIYLAFRLWTLISVFFGLIGLGLFLYYYRKRNESKKRNIGLILFGLMWLSVLVLMLFNNVFQSKAKNELFKKIELTKNTIRVCDNELSESQTKVYQKLLLEIREIPRHHSSPTYCGDIKFEVNGETVNLRFERDDNIKTEYWIYWDKYTVTKDNPIGYLRTEELNEMNCH